MFSFDNFLFDHMPAKSQRSLFDLCDPKLAYWPHDTLSLHRRSIPRCSNRRVYSNWINGLIDDLIHDDTVEMEIDCEKRPVEEVQKCEQQQLETEKLGEETLSASCEQPSVKSSVEKDEEMTEKPVSLKKDDRIVQNLKPTEFSIRASQYRPDEITCTVQNNQLTIKGKRQRKTANMFGYQSFERTFTLPKDVDHHKIICSMNANGLIKLNIPHKIEEAKKDEEKVISIECNSQEINQVEQRCADVVEESKVKEPLPDEPVVEDIVDE